MATLSHRGIPCQAAPIFSMVAAYTAADSQSAPFDQKLRAPNVPENGLWTHSATTIQVAYGDDRLGLVDSEQYGQMWSTIAMTDVFLNGVGWVMLGAVLALVNRGARRAN